MTNRDFDQDDARELAELCGYDIHKTWRATFADDPNPTRREENMADDRLIYNDDGNKIACFDVYDEAEYSITPWQPWSLETPMWQIQSLLETVREKGKKYIRDFQHELADELDGRVKYMSPIDWLEAPPEAICSAILSMEGE